MRTERPTRAALYSEASAARRESLRGDGRGAHRAPTGEISASGRDTLLAELLTEAIYLMDVEEIRGHPGLEVRALAGATLRGHDGGRAGAPACGRSRRAATYHGVCVRDRARGAEGRVVARRLTG